MISSKITALYERLSKDDEKRGESESISNQKMYLENYASKQGYINIQHYTDDGYTGRNFNRPGFKEMIKDIKNGKISTVIVKDMSRLGRNYLEVGYYTEILFSNYDVRFIAVNNNVDTENDQGNDFAPFLNIMNEWYAKDTSNKIKAVFNARMKKGLRCSGAVPYGYYRKPDDKQTLYVNEETAPVVKYIFKLAAEGYTLSAIQRKLYEKKIVTPGVYSEMKGEKRYRTYTDTNIYSWNLSTIADIIRRQEYLGNTVLKKYTTTNFKTNKKCRTKPEDRYVFYNTHEPIVTQEIWDLAQKFIGLHKKNKKDKIIPRKIKSNILEGYVYCSECGKRLVFGVRKPKGGKEYPSFVCNGKYSRSRNCTTSHFINAYTLEELLLNIFKRLYSDVIKDEKAFAERVLQKYENKKQANTSTNNQKLKSLEKRNNELNMLIKGLYENYINQILSEKQYILLMDQYNAEQKKIDYELEGIKKTNSQSKNSIDIDKFLTMVKKFKTPKELNESMLEKLLDKIVVHSPHGKGDNRRQQIDIYFKFIGNIDVISSEEMEKERELKLKEKKKLQAEQREERRRIKLKKEKEERWARNGGHKFAARKCLYCGKEFLPTCATQRYCNFTCRDLNNNRAIPVTSCNCNDKHPFPPKNCIICGKPFWPASGNQIVCSPECKKIRIHDNNLRRANQIKNK